jgi:hypothetical protein
MANVVTTFENFYKEHTWLTLGGLVVLGFIGYQLYQHFSGGASNTGITGSGSGTGTDTGQYYVAYVDEQPGNVVNEGPETTTNIINNPPTVGGGSTPPPKPPGVNPLIQRIRARNSQTGAAGYDALHPQGVPIRSSPGGKQVGYAPYGSAITLGSINPITGPGNFGSGFTARGGSDLWYKLPNNTYISQYDIVGFSGQSGR